MKQWSVDREEWAGLIASWAGEQPNVFLLDSCCQPDVGNLGEYEVIAGVGVKRFYQVEKEEQVDWQAIDRFASSECWKFFVISYDLNSREINPQSILAADEMAWPLMAMLEPQQVITLSRNGELRIYASEPEKLYVAIKNGLGATENAPSKISLGSSRDSMSQSEHAQKVAYIREEIAAGNMYEINLCMETIIDQISISNPYALHRQLLANSPAPFSGYVKIGPMHLLSASPERYLKKSGNRIYSQPIKGTASRRELADQDAASKQYLSDSLKERAEHVMIVDLVRNDLSKACKTGSITVEELCGIYGYRHVYQMISTVSGELRDGVGFVDALRASFPMGSMTGAPKRIVMSYIDAIEQTARGWYSGSIGYIRPDGDFDANVVIRSLLYDSEKQKAKYAAGGAITHDSDALAEYNECLLKVVAIRDLLYSLR